MRLRTLLPAAPILLLLGSNPARSEPIRCQRAIAKESSKFLQSAMKALGRCEDGRASGRLTANTDCHADPMTATLLSRAQAKLQRRINAGCGGQDRICGTGDDDPLASIGWGSVTACPNFENGSCTNAINHCGDVVDCLFCIDQAAVDQAISLYYGSLDSNQFGQPSALNSCQRVIGTAPAHFVGSKSKALQRCWDTRLKGLHSNPCPTPGDGIAGRRIQMAETRETSSICRRCGGSDGSCDGADDFTANQIGFAFNCPAVMVPGGASCGGSVNTLQDIVKCLDCVSEFKVDCADALAVPALKAYPTQCNPTTTTTIPTCPPPTQSLGSVAFTISPGTADCGGPALNPGPAAPFSGEVDDGSGTKIADLGVGCLYTGGGGNGTLGGAALTDGGTSDLDISGANGTQLTLAGSNGTGPDTCSRGAGPGKHCAQTLAACSSERDCNNQKGACLLDANCFFGPPTPVPSGPLSTCIVNVIGTDPCGTADLASGNSTLTVGLSSRLYLTGNAASPCPQCTAGTCSAGQNVGLPCSGGVGSKQTSRECPPSASQFIGELPAPLVVGTGTSTLTAPDGFLCPGQRVPGAFGQADVHTITQTGVPLLGGPSAFSTTLAGNLCAPATGVGLIDNVIDLPGPGSLSVTGQIGVCVLTGMCSTLCNPCNLGPLCNSLCSPCVLCP